MMYALFGTVLTELMLLVLSIGTGSFTARALMPQGRGALAAVLFWPQLIAALGLCSLPDAGAYLISDGTRPRSEIIATLMWLSLSLAALSSAVGYFAIPVLLGVERASLASLSQLYIIYVPFNFVALSLLAADQGARRFRRFNVLRLSVPSIYFAMLIGLWITGRVTVGWFVAANCLATIVTAVLRVGISRGELLRRPSWTLARSLVGPAARFHPTTLLATVASQIDNLFVLLVWNNETLGLYTVALTFGSAGSAVIAGALQKVMFPYLSGATDADARTALLARTLRHATVLLVTVSIGLGVLIPWIVPFFFGEAFRPAVPMTLWVLAAYVFVSLKNVLVQCSRGFGIGGVGFSASIVSLMVFIAFAWPLARAFGPTGIAIDLGLSNIIAVAMLVEYFARKGQQPIGSFWGLNPSTVRDMWWTAGRFVASLDGSLAAREFIA